MLAGIRKELLDLRHTLEDQILGQTHLISRLLIALLADGHLLVEGAPGLAKTRAVKALAHGIEGTFHRVQFTPDLLPGDLTGTDIYRPEQASFTFQPGPIFHEILLADEINRAPAKVQSALLEAMAERQVTVGGQTYPLSPLFLVMATQNPIEQEGTYPLPEAQLDRFLMYVKIDYPDAQIEKNILKLAREEAQSHHTSSHQTLRLSQQTIFNARQAVLDVHTSEALSQYIIDLVIATRKPEQYDSNLSQWIRFGASPRATIALDRCSKALAFLRERNYVTPEDIQDVAPDILRHRIIRTFEAEAQGISTDQCVTQLLQWVAVP